MNHRSRFRRLNLSLLSIVASAALSSNAFAATYGNHAYFLTQTATAPTTNPGLVPSSEKRFCKNQSQLSCAFNILSGGPGDYDIGISGPSGMTFPGALVFVTPYGSGVDTWCAADNTAGIREIFCGSNTRMSVRYISNVTDTGRGATAASGVMAYVMVNYTGKISTFKSAENYNSFNSTGRTNSVAHRGLGLYTVTLGGMSIAMQAFPNRAPSIQVQGDTRGQDTTFSAGLCTLESYGANATNGQDLDVLVRCFNGKAQPRDNNFALTFELSSGDLIATALSNRANPGVTGYFPQLAFPSPTIHVESRADSRGNRLTGRYIVNIPGMPNDGNVQLSAKSSHPDYCNIDTWGADSAGGIKINVSCYRLGSNGTANATYVDSHFFVSYYGPF